VLADPLFGTFYTQGFDPGRYRPEPLGLLPVGATITGWDTFLPQDSRALLTAHAKVELRGAASFPSYGIRQLISWTLD
jgi:hypothetical protein